MLCGWTQQRNEDQAQVLARHGVYMSMGRIQGADAQALKHAARLGSKPLLRGGQGTKNAAESRQDHRLHFVRLHLCGEGPLDETRAIVVVDVGRARSLWRIGLLAARRLCRKGLAPLGQQCGKGVAATRRFDLPADRLHLIREFLEFREGDSTLQACRELQAGALAVRPWQLGCSAVPLAVSLQNTPAGPRARPRVHSCRWLGAARPRWWRWRYRERLRLSNGAGADAYPEPGRPEAIGGG